MKRAGDTASPRKGGVGVYDEGNGVTSLYLSPVAPKFFVRGLQAWADSCTVVVFSNETPPEKAEPLPNGGWIGGPEQLTETVIPTEMIVFEKRPSLEQIETKMPASILAHPNAALPETLSPKFAVAITDNRHVVVLSRDQTLLKAALAGFMDSTWGVRVNSSTNNALSDLLEPIEHTSWTHISSSNSERFQSLRIETIDSESGSPIDEQRLVAPLDSQDWRNGWTW